MVLLLGCTFLCLTASVWCGDTQQVPYGLSDFTGSPPTFDCPKECFCPPSFPTALYCDNKNLDEIPLIPSRIRYLYINNNQIETVSEKAFSEASELKWINLSRNKITNKGIGKNIFKNLKHLLYLYMEENQLEEVPGPLPESLEQLRLAKNKISKIPEGIFDTLENLTLLDLHNNKLDDNSISANTLKGLKNLLQLNMAINTLKKMPPGLPTNTVQLFLDNNSIDAIPEDYFHSVPRISFIRLNGNKLSDKGVPQNIFNISSILDLQLSHNHFTEVPQIHLNLEHLHLHNNQILNVNGTMICPLPIELVHDNDFESGPRLRYLRLDGNEIKPPIPMDLIMCFRHLRAVII
ncbi:keratocan [Protopterus annectens]|uniref:keratocan n=1 Tax=Protopterus annectens TaxID=7888 RepID=UPI001CFA47BE|nr:keratocan [Protopterus annectens]